MENRADDGFFYCVIVKACGGTGKIAENHKCLFELSLRSVYVMIRRT